MTATTDVLARYGVDITDDELARDIDQALSDRPRGGTISGTELAYLAEHAGESARQVLTGFDPADARRRQALTSAETTAELVHGLLTREAAADRLGIDPSGVSRRIADGRLWAVARAGRRIPAWQIQDGRLLPGLPTVIAALPADVNPLAVEGLMTTPQDLLADQRPIDYLVAGGRPDPVAELVADLDRW